MSLATLLSKFNLNYCTFCYKSIDDQKCFIDDSQKLQNFTTFLQRFCSDNSPPVNLSSKLLQTCQPCLEIVDSFMSVYNQLKCLELQLMWKMQKLRSVMIYASRAPSRIKQFQEGCKSFEAAVGVRNQHVWKQTKTFRTLLIQLCSKKTKKIPPHVHLNTNPRAATKKQDQTDIVPILSISSEDADVSEAGSVSPDYTNLGGFSPQCMLSYAAVTFLSTVKNSPFSKTNSHALENNVNKYPPVNSTWLSPSRFNLQAESSFPRENVAYQINFETDCDPFALGGFGTSVEVDNNESDSSSVVMLTNEIDSFPMDVSPEKEDYYGSLLPQFDLLDNMYVTWEVGDEPFYPPDFESTSGNFLSDTASSVPVIKSQHSQPIFLTRKFKVTNERTKQVEHNSLKDKYKPKKLPSNHIFKCTKCPKTFKEKYRLLYHAKISHTERQETRLNEIKMTPDGMTIEDFCHKTTAKFSCDLDLDVCSEKFFTQDELKTHSKLHDQFKCNFCSLKFTFAITLAEHERKSHGLLTITKKSQERSLTCPRPLCMFRTNFEPKYFEHFLETHLKLTFNNPKCPICFKIFYPQSVNNLKSSVQYHYLSYHDKSGVPPEDIMDCDSCPAYFLTPHQLNCHQRLAHPKVSEYE